MSSDLNPDAPEFRPRNSFMQDGYSKSNKTVLDSRSYPAGPSREIYKTYRDFNVVSYEISKNVVVQSTPIVVAELPKLKVTSQTHEFHAEIVADATYSTLNKVCKHIKTIKGVKQPNLKSDKEIGTGVNLSPLNNTPVISKIEGKSATFIGAKNIPRPQLSFKDPVDNSHNLWVPKITHKPNSVEPLCLKVLYDKNTGDAIGFEHPYLAELTRYSPPLHAIEPDPALPTFPPPLDQTPLTLIDAVEKLDWLVNHLEECDEIAIDVEHHSYRTYQGITCLIQITTYEGGDFLIDTLAIREHIHKLNHFFTNPDKIKVFHGADNDVKWLQRDFGLYIVGLFDTYQAAKLLNHAPFSYKNMLYKYCGVDTDKKYQGADWRIRPLPEEMVTYARIDTHYLLYIWRMMKHELLQLDSGRPSLLIRAFDRSRHTCLLTYNKEIMDGPCHMGVYLRSMKTFNPLQLQTLEVLYKWRDQHARDLDEGPSYLIPNSTLISIAEKMPLDIMALARCCEPIPPFVSMNLQNIQLLVSSCHRIPVKPLVRQVTEGLSFTIGMVETPQQKYKLHDLAHLPEITEEQIKLDMAWPFIDESCVKRTGVGLNVQPDARSVDFMAANLFYAGDTLNAEAEMFSPPYDRYSSYKTLAHLVEVVDDNEKEASASNKGVVHIGDEQLSMHFDSIHVTEEYARMAQAVATQPENPTLAKVTASTGLEDDIPAASRLGESDKN